MAQYETPQKVFEINGIKFGGKVGETPIVLIGSIFYKNHKILEDPKKGVFDKKRAETLINAQEEISDKTGLPHVIDIGAEYPEAIIKYIDFVSNITDATFCPDGPTPEINIPAVNHISEIGLSDRVIYNSIDPHTKDEVLNAIKNAKIKASIMLTFHSKYIFPDKKIILLEGDEKTEGLLVKAERAGVDKPLIDTATLDIPSVGICARAIKLIKEKYGLPAGAGAHNALHTWTRRNEFGAAVRTISNVIINTIPQAVGADFLLIGPIDRAKEIFPTIALNDVVLNYTAARIDRIKVDRTGPISKIF
ncbi:MAG: tetrahydromethanopterin S-methyltransferase subunit H [Candidatus Helarchaeota archaeon]|nr:tetrahydromethanopterin S-methyltransferase subunit H [Candidatus Helarchaeota archaeon]